MVAFGLFYISRDATLSVLCRQKGAKMISVNSKSIAFLLKPPSKVVPKILFLIIFMLLQFMVQSAYAAKPQCGFDYNDKRYEWVFSGFYDQSFYAINDNGQAITYNSFGNTGREFKIEFFDIGTYRGRQVTAGYQYDGEYNAWVRPVFYGISNEGEVFGSIFLANEIPHNAPYEARDFKIYSTGFSFYWNPDSGFQDMNDIVGGIGGRYDIGYESTIIPKQQINNGEIENTGGFQLLTTHYFDTGKRDSWYTELPWSIREREHHITMGMLDAIQSQCGRSPVYDPDKWLKDKNYDSNEKFEFVTSYNLVRLARPVLNVQSDYWWYSTDDEGNAVYSYDDEGSLDEQFGVRFQIYNWGLVDVENLIASVEILEGGGSDGVASIHLQDSAPSFLVQSENTENLYAYFAIKKAGRFTYRLKVTAQSDNGDTVTVYSPKRTLTVYGDADKLELKFKEAPPIVDDTVKIAATLTNNYDKPLQNIGIDLSQSGGQFEILDGPLPFVFPTLSAGESMTFGYTLKVLRSGQSNLQVTAQALVNDEPVKKSDQLQLQVAPKLDISLSTNNANFTLVGQDIGVVMTLKNSDAVYLSGINVEALGELPNELLSHVNGPISAAGKDPRIVPISLAPGQTETVRWTYKAEQKGVGTLHATVFGTDPNDGSRYSKGADTQVAIETAALSLSDLRLSPPDPVPGQFCTIRGTISNIGNIDIENIDFSLDGPLKFSIPQQYLSRLSDEISPRIDKLAVGESRAFLVPLGIEPEIENNKKYIFQYSMSGTASVDGKSVKVSTDVGEIKGFFDLTDYWETIKARVLRELTEFLSDSWDEAYADFWSIVDGADKWADDTKLGGLTVGSAQGVVGAFEKLGDGLLTPAELLFTDAGQEKLTKTGEAIVRVLKEYRASRSNLEIARDAANIAVEGARFFSTGYLEPEKRKALTDAGINMTQEAVGAYANWMYSVEKAYDKGDTREVARLLTESGTNVTLAFAGDAAAEMAFEKFSGRFFKKLLSEELLEAAERSAAKGLVKDAAKIDAAKPGSIPGTYDALAREELKQAPTGPMRRADAIRAGVDGRELTWMQKIADRYGVMFVARPRPQEAIKWAEAGMNPKPMPVKLKSINEIDCLWLGYDCNFKGVVQVREPTNPFYAILNKVEAGEMKLLDPENLEILKRYNKRKAEWANWEKTFTEYNARKPIRNAKGEVIGYDKGIDVWFEGNQYRTTVSLDSEGFLIFDFNGQRVFSDIDLLQIVFPDGSIIPEKLHKWISDMARYGISRMHGASADTSDFPLWEVAKKVSGEYIAEHMAGGDPLLFIKPNGIIETGFVKAFETLPKIEGSNYDLYGKVFKVTYESK